MTISRKQKEYEINGKMWLVEQYADKPDFVWYWRYGYFTDYQRRYVVIVKDGLRSRPNLKRLSL